MTNSNFHWLILSQVWQIAIAVVLVIVFNATFAKQRPHLAYALWILVLVKCVTPPLWSSSSGLFCWLRQWEVYSMNASTWPVELGSRNGLPGESPLTSFPRPLDDHRVASLTANLSLPNGEGFGTDDVPALRSSHSGDVSRSRWSRVGTSLIVMWAVGTLVVVAIGIVRWLRFFGRIRASSVAEITWVTELVDRLRRTLGLRWPVRVVITSSMTGPAVIGFMRPSILLPESLVQDMTASQLSPIIAHELVHVRRWDLGVCLAQWMAKSVWWFHPMVHWASRRLSDEIERCCDEEVIANFHFDPAHYARSLLEVIDRKRALRAAPAFPGVRPLDVTSSRLERIMRLGQGSQSRTPRWCWAFSMVVAAVVLPGGLLVGEGEESPQDAKISSQNDGVTDPSKDPLAATALPPVNAEVASLRVYSVRDQLNRISNEHDISIESAKDELIDYVEAMLGDGRQNGDGQLIWSEDRLVARQNSSGHDLIAKAMSQVAEHGLKQFTMSVKFLSVANSDLARISNDDGLNVATSAKANSVQIVHDDQVQELINSLQKWPRTNVLQAPRITMWNEQEATISDRTDRAFIVGYEPPLADGSKDATPRMRKISEGSTVRLRPQMFGDNRVSIRVQIEIDAVRGIDNQKLSDTDKREIQIPRVDSYRLDTTVATNLGEAILIRGTDDQGIGADQKLSVLIQYKLEKARKSSLLTKTYAVADLVVPIPTFATNATTPGNSDVSIDSKSLVDLIQATVSPETWHRSLSPHSITFVRSNLSLVVAADRSAHRQIGKLLSELRKLQDVQVSYQTHLVKVRADIAKEILGDDFRWSESDQDDAWFPPQARLTSAKTKELIARLRREQLISASTPKFTLFNGQPLSMPITFGPYSDPLQTQAGPFVTFIGVAAKDHSTTSISVGVELSKLKDRNNGRLDNTGELLRTVRSHRVGDGESLLLDATDVVAFSRLVGSNPWMANVAEMKNLLVERANGEANERCWVLIQPKVIVQAEVEEASLPQSSGSSDRMWSKRQTKLFEK